MIIDGREIVFTEHFFEKLADSQSYSSVYSASQGRQLSTVIINFITNVIALNPYIFVDYDGLKTADQGYRRAVFKGKQALIYKLSMVRIDVLTIYHTSQNPDTIDLGDGL